MGKGKTKEEIIKEAYGVDYYNEFSEYIDDDGWIKFSDSRNFRQFNNYYGEIEISFFYTKWRAKHLKGIENY